MSDDSAQRPEDSPEEPPPVDLPRWVPILIALVLVAIAGLAVYTGMRFHGGRVAGEGIPARMNGHQEGGAPGEPQPGASRILPGETGENPPPPSTAQFEQRSRVRIEGTRSSGLSASYRASARRGLQFKVIPPDAIVYVNDEPIAPARQFESDDEVYEFAEPGNFTVRISAPGYQDAVYLITADPNARNEVVRIETKLEKK